MESSSRHSPSQLIANRYELLRMIGEGGMGEVWEARHLHLEASVAIKFAVERRASDQAFLERFRREACAMARLRAQDIVQVFDTGVHEGLPYLVMEMLDGETLRARLERERKLPLGVAAELARQMGRALSVIHRAGMVHRDITPGNLFLLAPTPESPELRVKLLDFGIAKRISNDQKLTSSGALVGSPSYMSPEQARAEAVDARSDLWSLAAVLYRCLAGVDPFVGRSVTDVLFSICTGELPRISQTAPELPKALDPFFERAFARNPCYRFSSAAELVAAFARIADAHFREVTGEMPAGVDGTGMVSPRGFSTIAPTELARTRRPLSSRPGIRTLAVATLSAGLATALSVWLGRPPAPLALPLSTPLSTQPGSANSVMPSPVLALPLAAPPAVPAQDTAKPAPWPPSAPPSVTPPVAPAVPVPLRREERPSKPAGPRDSSRAVVDPLFGLPLRKAENAEAPRPGPVPSGASGR